MEFVFCFETFLTYFFHSLPAVRKVRVGIKRLKSSAWVPEQNLCQNGFLQPQQMFEGQFFWAFFGRFWEVCVKVFALNKKKRSKRGKK